jgi:hypothetical protein
MGNVLVSQPVQAERAAAAQSVADANAAFEQLKADYHGSADQRAARDREQLSRLQGDPYFLNKQVGGNRVALNEQQVLESRIRQAELQAEALAASETSRIDRAMEGLIDQNESGATFGSQIPIADFADGVAGVLERGARPAALEHFLKTGAGGGEDRAHEIALASEWERRLMSDPDLQRRFLSGDPIVMAQFQAFSIYSRKHDE